MFKQIEKNAGTVYPTRHPLSVPHSLWFVKGLTATPCIKWASKRKHFGQNIQRLWIMDVSCWDLSGLVWMSCCCVCCVYFILHQKSSKMGEWPKLQEITDQKCQPFRFISICRCEFLLCLLCLLKNRFSFSTHMIPRKQNWLQGSVHTHDRIYWNSALKGSTTCLESKCHCWFARSFHPEWHLIAEHHTNHFL